MGWYFRKSKSFGPFRINMSKSGIGFSTGVRGARISVGPKGTFFNGGFGGLYYRKKLGSKAKKDNQYLGFAETSDTKTNNNVFLDGPHGGALTSRILLARLLLLTWICAVFVFLINSPGWSILIILSGIVLWRFFTVRINYSLDVSTLTNWERFLDELLQLRHVKGCWLIDDKSENRNAKENAGASSSVSRSNSRVRLVKAKKITGLGIKTNADSFVINAGKTKLLFLPDSVVVKTGIRTYLYPYEQLNLDASLTNFVEEEKVKKDAEIVDWTWLYVNRDGTPDKRYNNNRMLPVCCYGVITISYVFQLLEIELSDNSVQDKICEAFYEYKNNLDCLQSYNEEVLEDQNVILNDSEEIIEEEPIETPDNCEEKVIPEAKPDEAVEKDEFYNGLFEETDVREKTDEDKKVEDLFAYFK